MEHPAVYQLALRRIHGIGTVFTKRLIERFGDAGSVFRASRPELEQTGLHTPVIDAILHLTDFSRVARELEHMRREGIQPLFFTDPGYPRRLRWLPKAPALLFYQGIADLNAEKIIAIAGTRTPTRYGNEVTATLTRELAQPGLLIVSGLAFGIDAVAHKTALEKNIQTIGIIGHGLYHVYPSEHAGLFRKMQKQGGLLTPFPPETKPGRHTFPIRNRLVAGMCDALIVMETKTEGGSLSAAAAAREFGKKIFAVPGRINDVKSLGCLHLIQQQHAAPLLSANQLNAAMGWHWAAGNSSHQPKLPFSTPAPADPNPPQPPPQIETQLLQLLNAQQLLTFDDLITMTHQPVPALSVALLNLELRGAIRSLPGRRYQLAS